MGVPSHRASPNRSASARKLAQDEACVQRVDGGRRIGHGVDAEVGPRGGTVLTLCPPLTIAEADLRRAFEIVAEALREV
jgi:4-aminobutyrate aminotransferase-like enzyme